MLPTPLSVTAPSAVRVSCNTFDAGASEPRPYSFKALLATSVFEIQRAWPEKQWAARRDSCNNKISSDKNIVTFYRRRDSNPQSSPISNPQ